MSRLIRLVVATAIFVIPAQVFAQEEPPSTPGVVDHQPVDLNGPVFVPPLSLLQTPAAQPPLATGVDIGPSVARSLRDATAFCQAIVDPSYRVDCLAERLEEIARSMPTSGPYAETRAALLDAANQLETLARQNADPAKPRQRFASPGAARPQTSSRPLTPVREDALPAVQAAAVAIIERTETVLLRSSETQVAQAAQIQQIAAAVGSNKVLLRSA